MDKLLLIVDLISRSKIQGWLSKNFDVQTVTADMVELELASKAADPEEFRIVLIDARVLNVTARDTREDLEMLVKKGVCVVVMSEDAWNNELRESLHRLGVRTIVKMTDPWPFINELNHILQLSSCPSRLTGSSSATV